MTPRWRWSLLSLAAIATGVATFVAPDGSKPIEVAAPAQRAVATPAALHSSSTKFSELPAREAIGRQRGDMFATRSWAPPAPPPPQQQAAPAPPPNPYRFAGTMHVDGKRKVFLALGDRLFEAKEGETLEQGFRVQSVTGDAVILAHEALDNPVAIALVFQDPPPQTAAAPRPASAAGATVPPIGSPLPR